MNQIVVKKDARQLGVENPVGCLIKGIDVQIGAPSLDEDIAKIEKRIQKNVDEILDKQEVKAFHDLYAELDYPEQVPSGEQLVKLIEKKGLNRNNNIVDAYNIASAEFGASLGMHDTATLQGDIVIERASGGERFLPIYHKDYVTAQPGDLLYRTDEHVLALFGGVTRDSDEFKITDLTDEALLVARGNHETSEEYNRQACRRAYELIARTCPDAEMEFLDVVYEDKKRLVAP